MNNLKEFSKVLIFHEFQQISSDIDNLFNNYLYKPPWALSTVTQELHSHLSLE